MLNELHRAAPASPAERKKALIAQGASYRGAIVESKNGAYANLRPDALASNAVSHIMMTALAAFKGTAAMHIGRVGLQTVLPLVAGGISALSKSRLLKPVIATALIVGVGGAVATLVLKNKSRVK